jgi:hypothetical protein
MIKTKTFFNILILVFVITSLLILIKVNKFDENSITEKYSIIPFKALINHYENDSINTQKQRLSCQKRFDCLIFKRNTKCLKKFNEVYIPISSIRRKFDVRLEKF